MKISNDTPGVQADLLTAMQMQLDTMPVEKINATSFALFDTQANLRVKCSNQNISSAQSLKSPELDDANEELAAAADLEALIAYLTMEQDEKQAVVMKECIETLKGRLKSNHQNTLDKIQKSIDESIKAEKAAKAKKAMSWLSAIFAVVVAVVVTLCTGGLAAGLAITGAVLAVTSAILDETGASKKICKAIADSLKKNNPDWSKNECNAWAQGIYGGIFLVLGLGTSIASMGASGGKALLDIGQTVAKVIKGVTTSANTVLNVGGIATGGVSTAYNYTSGKAQADVSETEATLRDLQRALEQSEDELKDILEQLSETMGQVLAMLESKTDVLADITEKIGLHV